MAGIKTINTADIGARVTLKATFDLAALDSADWSGESSYALTPSAGTVTSAVTWTFGNAGGATAWGPNGSTGVLWDLPANTGNWDTTAYPTVVPYMRAACTNFIKGGSATLNTELIVLVEWVGDVPTAAYHWTAVAFGDGTDYIQAVDLYISSRDFLCRRNLAGATTYINTAAASTFYGVRALNGGLSALAGYGTSGDASWDGVTVLGQASFGGNPATSNILDFGSSDIIIGAGSIVAGTGFDPILSKIHVWEVEIS